MISRYILIFMVYSLMGWVYESILTVFKDGHWEKRGFLFGPICPIYGVGAVSISLIATYMPSQYVSTNWKIFLISFVGSFVLEYVTSYVLEQLFHAVWWDYSSLPLNLHGRSSLPSSLIFGITGIYVVKVLAPFTERTVAYIPSLPLEITAFILIALLSSDLTLTISVLTNFARYVQQAEFGFHERMTIIVKNAREKMEEAKTELPSINDLRDQSFGHLTRLAIGRVHSFRFPRISKEKMTLLLKELRNNSGRKSDHKDEHHG